MAITEHRNQHLNDAAMHEVKGFPSAQNGYAYIKNIRGASEWRRVARQENVIASINGYDAPLTEVNNDVYKIESPLLEIANIAWQSVTTVRFTFDSGYTNIYATGNYLQISGATNDIHNGVWLISAINASYLEITNENVTDATDDETASPSTGYVSHEDYDPENLANSQSIPRLGLVKYNEQADLWFGDVLQTGDEYYELATESIKVLKSDGDVGSSGAIEQIINVSAAEIVTLFSVGKTLATCGSDEFIEYRGAVLVYDYGTAAYTSGGEVAVYFSGGTIASFSVSAANCLGAGSDNINTMVQRTTVLIASGESLVLKCITGDFVAGSAIGVARLHISYKIHKTKL